jgi:hypothetical protein
MLNANSFWNNDTSIEKKALKKIDDFFDENYAVLERFGIDELSKLKELAETYDAKLAGKNKTPFQDSEITAMTFINRCTHLDLIPSRVPNELNLRTWQASLENHIATNKNPSSSPEPDRGHDKPLDFYSRR